MSEVATSPPTNAAPPLYLPFLHGRYDVAPGLTKFGRDAGGAAADSLVFQLDRTFDAFRAAKLASRAADLGRYVCSSNLTDAAAAEVASFTVNRLAREHRSAFRVAQHGGHTTLRCRLTGERLTFDDGMRLTRAEGAPRPAYADALDALASQVQEDLAIVSTAGDRHWLSYAHVCLPNGWAPAEKVGRCFAGMHEPVAGMAEMNRRGAEFARVMTSATDGLVRFAWGVTFDEAPNHHPDLPRTVFDPARPRAFVRVERQTIRGFARVAAALFTIRTYLYDCERLRADAPTTAALVSALRSMSPESLAYKGLADAVDGLLRWLARG